MDTEHEWTRQELRRAVERLSVRERQVITLRCGLLDEQDHTLEEVSHLLQVTPERVHQLEERAWRKLKQDGLDGEAGAFVPVN
ncbi:MAG: sigma-70 family RNA polymerase sigma factor [Ktedonobacteraceae bacterium]|nr:sigma-70 family RNA polymerase sigma factor [Ktedonobacteraceae bacterium]